MQLIFNLILDFLLAVLWLFIYLRRKAHEGEEKLLKEQERFLEELAGQYAKRGDMLEAFEDSMQVCESGAQRELMGLLDVLRSDGAPEDGGAPRQGTKGACLLLLFTLCYTIRTFGDLRVQGVSLFVHNIRYIKEEVRTELLRRQEGRFAFLGLTALCVLPFFFQYTDTDVERFYQRRAAAVLYGNLRFCNADCVLPAGHCLCGLRAGAAVPDDAGRRKAYDCGAPFTDQSAGGGH